jgi:hypothetical protein
VSVTGSTSRIHSDTLDSIASRVQRAALAISRELGFTGESAGRSDSHDAA